MTKLEIWLRGAVAAVINGAAGGVLTGLAAVGIDPQHFNLAQGFGAMSKIAAAAATINAVIGLAAYLQKSPLTERRLESRSAHWTCHKRVFCGRGGWRRLNGSEVRFGCRTL